MIQNINDLKFYLSEDKKVNIFAYGGVFFISQKSVRQY